MNIGERIRNKRLELNMSQEELAKKCGYKSRSSIQKIECSRALPYKKMIAMARALEVDISYFLDDLAFLENDYSYSRQTTDANTFSNDELLLIEKYRSLSDENKSLVRQVLQAAYAVDTNLYKGDQQ